MYTAKDFGFNANRISVDVSCLVSPTFIFFYFYDGGTPVATCNLLSSNVDDDDDDDANCKLQTRRAAQIVCETFCWLQTILI